MLIMFGVGRDWLYGCLTVNLLMVSIFGSKLISVGGQVTNMGNVFYAMAFFAIYLLLEYGDRTVASRVIWTGTVSLILFSVLSQIALFVSGTSSSTDVSVALDTVFSNSLHIAFASLSAFIVAQVVNSTAYMYLKELMHERHLWLRLSLAIVVVQAIDSVIFFSIAFFGTLSADALMHVMLTGYALKVTIGLVTIPMFYMSRLFVSAR